MKRTLRGLVLVLAVAAAACGSAGGTGDLFGELRGGEAPTGAATEPPGDGTAPTKKAKKSSTDGGGQGGSITPRVDPRRGGLEVGLGEWAVTPEFEPIRPGRVSFVVTNHGTMQHGFEIELEGDGDNSGHGSGDGLKAESNLLDPGQSTTVTLDLPAGLYKMECLVDGHDDLGMEIMFEVREGAPLRLIEQRPRPGGGGAVSVAIADFAFPAQTTVDAGATVTFTNDDPTEHTVTADDGSFDSGIMGSGDTFEVALDAPGSIAYHCDVHPSMQGVITVQA